MFLMRAPFPLCLDPQNFLFHDYENVDLAVLLGTLATSLPELLKQIENLLYREIQESHLLSDAEEAGFER